MTHLRKAVVAGQFYPGNSLELRAQIDEYLNAANVPPAPERVRATIVPHAGYIYSGPTAAFAYARVRGKKPRRVILLGCSHRYNITQAVVYARGAFETPLGTFPVDEPFAARLMGDNDLEDPVPHLAEHSLEVQLPFLGVAVGVVPIVPILFGPHFSQWHDEFAERLAALVAENDLVIASTDLSHYLPQADANESDRRAIDMVLSKDRRALVDATGAGAHLMCGTTAVATTMAFAQAVGAQDWSLLDYRTSAEASGDYSRVVGYAAVSMEKGEDSV